MARGPDGQGGGAGFSLADQLFNADSVADLGREFSVLPGFDPGRFQSQVMAGLHDRTLLDRLEWIADALESQLPADFGAMAEALEAAMPPILDPDLKDDDFGRFIHAVPGVLAVRHGLEHHPERALDLIHAATRRFSMEYPIRHFLNRWPDVTLGRLQTWAEDPNYHVRRLVSEGTRPRLPWGKAITLDPLNAVPLLDVLHADPTRFVTRSVANHLNDLTRAHGGVVVQRLEAWGSEGRQSARELDWMSRHALRGAVKRGDRAALDHLGYRPGAVSARLEIATPQIAIGDTLHFVVVLEAPALLPVMVDYRLRFARPSGTGEKVFKLKTARLKADTPLRLDKAHRLKGDATTFRLYPGRHHLTVQVNGEDVAEAGFDLLPQRA